MRKTLISMACYLLVAATANAWHDTLFDTVAVRWPNGNLKEYYTRYWFLGNEKGFRPHGQYSSYYQSGQLQEQGFYRWNVKTGAWINWDENGNRISEVDYRNGAKTGLHIEWYPDFSLKTYGYFSGDMKNGLWIHRMQGDDRNNPNLLIDSVQFFRNDTLLVFLEGHHGDKLHPGPSYYNSEYDLWIEWKRHSSINILTNYRHFSIGKMTDGKKHGKWLKLAPTGELIQMDYYENGELWRLD